jgi:hypothetical protein
MNERTFTSGPLILAPGVELLTGPDNVPLLHIPERQIHVRLGATAVEILRLLNGRRTIKQEEIYIHLRCRYHLGEKGVRRLLTSFLTGLDQLGALARGKP